MNGSAVHPAAPSAPSPKGGAPPPGVEPDPAAVSRIILLVPLAALAALAVFSVYHDVPSAYADHAGLVPVSEADICPGGTDMTSLNPAGLRAFDGDGVLTLAWFNPDPGTDRGINYLVRWQESGTGVWQNPHGAVGERFSTQPRYTHDIAGLEDGTAYDAEVRIRLVSAIGPGTEEEKYTRGMIMRPECSQWVSVTGTTQAAAPIWSAILTVKQLSLALGCHSAELDKKCSESDVLTSYQFTHGATRTISEIALDTDYDELIFNVGAVGDAVDDLTLLIDGAAFPLKDATHGTGSNFNDHIWTNAGLSWSVGDTVSVSLVAPPPPTEITVSATGTLREGGPPVNVFFTFDHPALARGGATLGLNDDHPARYQWLPDISEGATVAVMQMYVPEDDIDNNCREGSASVTFGSQVAGGVYLSKDFSYTVVDNDGADDNACTGSIVDGSPPRSTTQGLGGTEGSTGTVTRGGHLQTDVQNGTSSGTEGDLGIFPIPEDDQQEQEQDDQQDPQEQDPQQDPQNDQQDPQEQDPQQDPQNDQQEQDPQQNDQQDPQEQDPQAGLPDVVKRYDTDGDGSINYQEWQVAVNDYSNNDLTNDEIHAISAARSYG